MIPVFMTFLGIVYQTMRSSFYDKRASGAQTDSFDLMKMNNVTSNVKQVEPSTTNKITKVGTTTPYTANTETHPSGRYYFRNEMQIKR